MSDPFCLHLCFLGLQVKSHTEVGREPAHLHREPDVHRSWLKVPGGFGSTCIIKALKNRSVVRGGPGGQREGRVLPSGRRDADVKFTSLGTLGRGEQVGTEHLEETFEVEALELHDFCVLGGSLGGSTALGSGLCDFLVRGCAFSSGIHFWPW